MDNRDSGLTVPLLGELGVWKETWCFAGDVELHELSDSDNSTKQAAGDSNKADIY